MSITKNALIRYKVLDKCFRNTGRMYFWDDLLDECNEALMELSPDNSGISRRQLFDDIRYMESEQGWSIMLERIRYGRKTYYRYEDTSFSINNQPLNELEAELIKSALQIIARFSGTPQFEWVNEMIPMFESKFGLIKRKNEVIKFEENIDLKGLNYLTPLFNAIINERVLSVMYKDFKSEIPYEIILHPYYLKQYNNRWFVLGLRENRESIWTVALDRIESVKETDLDYEPTDIDWDDYFYDMIGVTRMIGNETTEVVLRFLPEVAPYVITKPIHPTQVNKFDANGLEVKINVIPNPELENVIFSYSNKVIVLKPKELRDRIAERLKSAYLLY